MHRAVKFDVAILGTHLSCGLLAAVLARHHLRVVLFDSDQGEELGGETTVPYTAEAFFTLARRFGVPEIAGFGLTSGLPDPVRLTSGVKRSLGFLHHTAGAEHDPRRSVQFNVPGEHAEWHPYRPFVDQYVVDVARRYGAVLPDGRPCVTDVQVSAEDVTILADDGSLYRARCVIDGSGTDSPLVRRLGLLDAEPRLVSRSRVLASHMLGVTPFEEHTPLDRYDSATPWSAGTLSHLFEGGWLQVAHFATGSSLNPLTSVVASFDAERFADLPADPERAFRALVGRFPSIERSFRGAAVSGRWHTDRRFQRTVRQTAGDRWLLFDRSASRNDLFLSRDLTMSAEMINVLAPVLLRAAELDDWSQSRLSPVASFQNQLIGFHDRLLASARVAASDFRLWNAYSRVWLLWSMLSALSLKAARNDSLAAGSWDRLAPQAGGPWWFDVPRGLPELLNMMFDLLDEVRAGSLASVTAADRIFGALRRADFVPPVYRFADPKARYYHFRFANRLRMLMWARTSAPPELRRAISTENLTNVPPAPVH
ncbi:hypothetical protein [Micromonospora sp. WMMD998]|uniref:NAD(P)/FAD-dependent oxidoreductase n=1 Tax=Micromonospora sp. WMMD998 TaxID=3016092 RepID=UPI00249B2CF3|nr:hypothetical protein [Micromonospora sp. WMMD998]WFE41122.1 hypothetical protein O7619_22715 [Micromonospora sp. WMMD998]